MQDLEGPITAKAEQVRTKFHALLDKTNKENPGAKDIKDLEMPPTKKASPRLDVKVVRGANLR